jgi:hypothetical protein
VFAPAANVSKVELKGPIPQALAFDSTGRLLVGSPNGVLPLTAERLVPQRSLVGYDANVLAADANGTFAVGDAGAGLGDPVGTPTGVTSAPDGSLWFLEQNRGLTLVHAVLSPPGS